MKHSNTSKQENIIDSVYFIIGLGSSRNWKERSKRLIAAYTQAPENVKKDVYACFNALWDTTWLYVHPDGASVEQLLQALAEKNALRRKAKRKADRWQDTLIYFILCEIGNIRRDETHVGLDKRSNAIKTIYHNASEESKQVIDQCFEALCEVKLKDVVSYSDTISKNAVVWTNYTK